MQDSWCAMSELVTSGKVRFVGVSNFDRALIERSEAIRHVDSLQQELSMLALDDHELVRWCGEAARASCPTARSRQACSQGRSPASVRSPCATGAPRMTRGSSRRGDWTGSLSLVEKLRPIAARVGCTLAQLALAWNVHQPGVTAAIAGSRSARHVRDDAGAGDLALDDATLAELESVLT